MALHIIKAGIQDSVQDFGRQGYRHLGINPGGSMDSFSAQVANALVGNSLNEAVIELHFPASSFFFNASALIAIGGADFSARLNEQPVEPNRPLIVHAGAILHFAQVQTGTIAYLTIRGGLNIEPWLDSYSTNLKANIGGWNGKALQKGDQIGFKDQVSFTSSEFTQLPFVATQFRPVKDALFLLPGNEYEWLSTDAKQQLTAQLFKITNQSDRMGFRLNGLPLEKNRIGELISSGVVPGTIQLLPDGQLIVLMADHQTTGGYPRVAHIISAHQGILAQKKPGDNIRFEITDQSTAENLLLTQHRDLLQLQQACLFKLEQWFNREPAKQ